MDQELTHSIPSEEDLERDIRRIAEFVSEATSAPMLADAHRLEQMDFAYKALRYLTKDADGVKVSYTLHTPLKGWGTIFLEGAELTFLQPEWFVRAAEFSSNMEVYPRTDGTVCMALSFGGIAKPIEEEC